MLGYLIDPEKKSVSTFEFRTEDSGEVFKAIAREINADYLEMIKVSESPEDSENKYDVLFVDEDAKMKESFESFRFMGMQIVGKAMFVGLGMKEISSTHACSLVYGGCEICEIPPNAYIGIFNQSPRSEMLCCSGEIEELAGGHMKACDHCGGRGGLLRQPWYWKNIIFMWHLINYLTDTLGANIKIIEEPGEFLPGSNNYDLMAEIFNLHECIFAILTPGKRQFMYIQPYEKDITCIITDCSSSLDCSYIQKLAEKIETIEDGSKEGQNEKKEENESAIVSPYTSVKEVESLIQWD